MSSAAVKWSSARPWLIGLLVLTALRLTLAALVPLAPDEAYYWLWSRHLQPGYFDDAPLIALWIRVGTAIAGNTPLGIRLLSPFACGVGSILLWRAGKDFFSGDAGITAAALLNATLIFGVGSIITTPDTPLLLFWTATLAALGRWYATGDDRWWVAAGLAAGMALDAKYTGLLVFVVAGVWLLSFPEGRTALRRPLPWVGLGVGFVIFLPVTIWNADNHFVSFVKQGSRSTKLDVGQFPDHFVGLVFGQLGLATPVVFVLMAVGSWCVACSRNPAHRLVAISTWVPALIFVEHTLSGAVQANWPAIVYPGAALAAAGSAPVLTQRWRIWAVGIGFTFTAVVYLQALAQPIPFPAHRDPIALQLAGWSQFTGRVAKVAHGEAIVSTDYSTAAELSIHLPRNTQLIAVGQRWKYFDLPRPATPLAGIVVQSDRRGALSPAFFKRIHKLCTLARTSQGSIVQTYTLYRAVLRPTTDAAVLKNRS